MQARQEAKRRATSSLKSKAQREGALLLFLFPRFFRASRFSSCFTCSLPLSVSQAALALPLSLSLAICVALSRRACAGPPRHRSASPSEMPPRAVHSRLFIFCPFLLFLVPSMALVLCFVFVLPLTGLCAPFPPFAFRLISAVPPELVLFIFPVSPSFSRLCLVFSFHRDSAHAPPLRATARYSSGASVRRVARLSLSCLCARGYVPARVGVARRRGGPGGEGGPDTRAGLLGQAGVPLSSYAAASSRACAIALFAPFPCPCRGGR